MPGTERLPDLKRPLCRHCAERPVTRRPMLGLCQRCGTDCEIVLEYRGTAGDLLAPLRRAKLPMLAERAAKRLPLFPRKGEAA